VAVALWQILLVNRYPIVQSFIQFIEVNTKKSNITISQLQKGEKTSKGGQQGSMGKSTGFL
jgi:hypothetical protein